MTVNCSDGVHLNWNAIGETTDLLQVLDAIPPEEIIERLGVPFALQIIGANKILESVGHPRGFDAKETEARFKGLMANFTSEQVREKVRQVTKE
jgi:hypothetical protein